MHAVFDHHPLGSTRPQRSAAEGMQPADIAIIAAAAGGPEGLIPNGLDQWLFGSWLESAPRWRKLAGAPIGARAPVRPPTRPGPGPIPAKNPT